jgi:hypothetical protein
MVGPWRKDIKTTKPDPGVKKQNKKKTQKYGFPEKWLGYVVLTKFSRSLAKLAQQENNIKKI